MHRSPIAPIGIAVLLALGMITGCDSQRSVPDGERASSASDESTTAEKMEALLADPSSVEFADEVESNREADGSIAELEFLDSDGDRVRLDQYVGDKNVLLVFTRGFSGQLCPFCTTQTSRLITNYDEFKRRDTEVLLVYPGQTEQLDEFKAASMEDSGADKFPFPVLLDENLTAVNQLDIAAQLAHPSIYIIDKQGSVRLSYVGQSPIDRPSVKALLDQLDRLPQ